MHRWRTIVAAACLLAAPAAAQQDPAPVTRAGLQALMAEYEQAAVAGPTRERGHARQEAERIRRRLEDGDFQVGDRILLSVDGHPELSDTFTVTAGRVLVLPSIGQIPVSGLLRSELQENLVAHVGRFIRDPALQARSMIRISIIGEVAQPGYYVVSSESLVTDALMLAGGPTPRARLPAMRIQRGDQRVWDGNDLQAAITQGQTMDQLAVRAGDQIVVPPRTASTMETFGRTFLWVVPAVVGLISLF